MTAPVSKSGSARGIVVVVVVVVVVVFCRRFWAIEMPVAGLLRPCLDVVVVFAVPFLFSCAFMHLLCSCRACLQPFSQSPSTDSPTLDFPLSAVGNVTQHPPCATSPSAVTTLCVSWKRPPAKPPYRAATTQPRQAPSSTQFRRHTVPRRLLKWRHPRPWSKFQ